MHKKTPRPPSGRLQVASVVPILEVASRSPLLSVASPLGRLSSRSPLLLVAFWSDKDLTKFCRLVYRDMKHENIGFDARGDVKVFDFGLCKALSPSLKASDAKTGLPVYGYNLTRLTGKLYYDRHLNDSVALYLTRRFYAGLLMPIFSPVGSLPYMAPEVAKGNPYDYMCDVFSFAILF